MPTSPANDDMTLRELVLSIREWICYALSKWVWLLLFALIGLAMGAAYSYFSKATYTATATFVLDEGGSSNNAAGALGGLGSLLGGSSTQEGLFQGDNIIWLYSSDRMLSQMLLSKVKRAEDSVSLVYWLLDIDKDLQRTVEKIKENDPDYKDFPKVVIDKESLSRNQKKVLNAAIKVFRVEYLTVKKEEKTSGIINVSVASKDELFSLLATESLMNLVNRFYVQTKTLKLKEQVEVLAEKVNEANKQLNTSMYEAAGAADAIPNPNPNLSTLKVRPQREAVDIQVNSASYTAMKKQLETARIALQQETPLIQIVDAPAQPLPVSKPGMVKFMVIGGLLFLFLGTLSLFFRRFIKLALEESQGAEKEMITSV